MPPSPSPLSLPVTELKQQTFEMRTGFAIDSSLSSYIRLWIHIVGSAVTEQKASQYMVSINDAMASIRNASHRQKRIVDVQGSAKKRWYCCIHACANKCICKYDFEGTSRHDVYKIDEIDVFREVSDWFHGFGDVAELHRINELLANAYSRELDEAIDWHSDIADLYENSTDVVSLSVGSPGVFCFSPWANTGDDSSFKKLGSKSCSGAERRTRAVEAGLRGLVPLFIGVYCRHLMQKLPATTPSQNQLALQNLNQHCE